MAKKKLPHHDEIALQVAIEGLIKGYKSSDLAGEIKLSLPEISIETIELAVRRAIGIIREQTLVDIDKIIPQHVEIYEQVFKKLDELGYIPGKLKAMRGKEKLLGMHRESNMIEIHNSVDIEIEVEPEYDLSKLSSEEQLKLERLMKLAAIDGTVKIMPQ